MALNPAQETWLQDTLKVLPAMDEAIDLATHKQMLLNGARQRIEGSIGEIRVGQDFDAVMKNSGVTGFIKERLSIHDVMPSISQSGDANEEVDTYHDLPDIEGISQEDFVQLLKAQSLIAEEAGALRSAMNPKTKKPLFSDREISEAIWAPLLRRKVVAENAIPDRYSEVARTFSGASTEYEIRIAAYTDSLGRFDSLIEKLGIGGDLINAAGSGAGAVVSSLSSLGVNINPTEAAAILKATTATLTGSITATQSILKNPTRKGFFSADNIQSMATWALKNVASIIPAAMSTDSKSDQALAKTITSGLTLGLAGVTFAMKIRAGKPDEALAAVGDMVAASLAGVDYGIKMEGGSDTMPVTATEMGIAISDAIKTGPAAKAFIEAILKGDGKVETAAGLLAQVLKGGVDAGSQWLLDNANTALESQYAPSSGPPKTHLEQLDTYARDLDAPQLRDQQDGEMGIGGAKVSTGDYNKNVLEGDSQTAHDQAVAINWDAAKKLIEAKGSETGGELKELFKDDKSAKAMSAVVKKQEEAAAKEEAKNFEAELAEEERAFRDMLNRSETGDDEDDIETLEKLILLLKRDQMIVTLAEQLTKAGPQAVAAFLPQAGIAVSAVELVQNFRRAVVHFMAMREWQENTADARSAMSVQAEAMINRANLSREQGINATVKMLEKAVQMVAQASSYAGHFAPVGHVIAAGVTALVGMHDLVYKFYTKGKLASEWKVYVKARTDPRDRKAVRAAIRKDPTLAKYVIAYGARVENNAVARNALKRCGLTDEILDSKSANTQRVEAYLEALYPEDPVLLVAQNKPKSWHPGPVEFTSDSFMAFVGAAQTEAKPKLKAGAASKIMGLMQRREAAGADVSAKRTAWTTADEAVVGDPPDPALEVAATEALHALQQALDTAERVSKELAVALAGFKPTDDKGSPHKEFAEYARQLTPKASMLVDYYRREAEGLAAADGALVRDLEYGLRG